MDLKELAVLLEPLGAEASPRHTAPVLEVRRGLPAGPAGENALYVLSPGEDPAPLLGQRTAVLLWGPLPEGEWAANALTLAAGSPEQVLPLLEQALAEERRLADCARQLLEVLSAGGSLQDLVDRGFQLLNMPLAVFDAGFRLVAANWDVAIPDPAGQRMLEARYLSPEDMKAINIDQTHAKVMGSDKPVLVRSPRYPGARLVVRLNIGPKNVGHLVATDQLRPISPWDYRAVALLRDVMVQLLRRDEFVRSSDGFYYEYLIADLLDGRVDAVQLRDRLVYADLHFEALTYLTVAEPARSSRYLNASHLRSRFERLLPGSRSMMYKGQILLITTRRAGQPVSPEETDAFRRCCREEGLYCGRSNPFFQPEELPDFYRQAVQALELGAAGGPSLYVYGDLAAAHLCSLICQAERPEVLAHPAVRLLLRADREKGTELAQTLYHFLRCERNSFAAADRMHIHRNTLLYRMKKVEQLVQLDLDDPGEREYLWLSLRLCLGRPDA